MKRMMPHEKVMEIMRNTEPQMRYDGKEGFADWQKKAREKLCELLGMNCFGKCEPDVIVEFEKQTDTFKEIRFCFQSESGYYVPCHLRIPAGAEKPLPVMICLQGHSKGMHISLGETKYEGEVIAGDRDFAVRVIEEGYCALVMEQRDMGECGGTASGTQCHVPTMANLLIGRTTLGERIWDIQRAIDALEKYFPQTDTERVMCMGTSGGGTATFYAACIEERIKAVICSASLCTFDDSIAAMFHCTCNFVPGIRKYFDMCDLAGLIIPRRLVMVNGKEDDIFPIEGARKTAAFIKQLYDDNGAGEQFAAVEGNGGHRFYADDTWPVFRQNLWK